MSSEKQIVANLQNSANHKNVLLLVRASK